MMKLRASRDAAAGVLIAAKYGGVEIQLTNGAAGTVVLSTAAGELTGVGAILRYVGRLSEAAALEGETLLQSGQVDSWIEFATLELSAAEGADLNHLLVAALAKLDTVLQERTFLVGDAVSLADIAVVCAVRGFQDEFASLTAVKRWFATCVNQPAFRAVLQIDAAAGPSALSSATTSPAPDEPNIALDLLKELKIESKTHSHPEAFTVEEQAQHVGHLPGALTRNLFVKDKKHGMFLVTAWEKRNTKDTKVLAKLLGLTGKTNLRLCDEELLTEKLGVKRGSLSPFALVNDKAHEVKFAIDQALLEQPYVNSHPLRCDRTTALKPDDLMQFVKHCGHEPILLDFSGEADEPAGGDAAEARVAKPAPAPKATAVKGGGKSQQKPKPTGAEDGSGKTVKKETLLKIVHSKADDFAGWYTEVITSSEMIDYYDISGCYILRPWSYAMWEEIQKWFDAEIKAIGVQNAYFPLFVSEKALNAEKDHVEGFAPEVAWVTKSGESKLEQPIAVRPTSETIMYPAFANWIRSHRDLPLLLNQWCNVVRWEFKYPTPFLRSREFLWQEGHTAHATLAEANEMVMSILELYKKVYQDLLAVPVIPGKKTEKEKFAGGHFTTTVEAYIPGTGRAIQGATSHNLGQNFGKMFKIAFENDEGGKSIPWQTSWGLTTRTIGVMVMVHGDDQGLVLPPRIAPTQVIIIPIISKKCTLDDLAPFVSEIAACLKEVDVRVQVDQRSNYTAGWKYNHWEQKGVPIRIEVGPRDLQNRQARLVRRDNMDGADVAFDELRSHVPALLVTIQDALFTKALAARDEKYKRITEWKDFVPALNENCIVLTPFCNEMEWEETVKTKSREEYLNGEAEDERTATSVAAKTLCIPFDQPELPKGTPCFVSGKPAECWVLWGRSY